MKGLAFIPDKLEEYPLTTPEYRVYCRIVNRSRAGDSTCTESIGTIASGCGLNHHTVRAAIRLLSAADMISVETASGKSNTIVPIAPESWKHPDEISELRESLTPSKKSRGARNRGTQNEQGSPSKKSAPPLLNEAPKDTKNTNTPSLPSQEGDGQGDLFSEVGEQVEEPKTGNELWDFEFESEFWPIAFKKVSVGKARESYRTARKKASKKKILAAWDLVNGNDFPEEAEERGTKKYIPMPSTWLNQERWEDEGIVARLEEASSPEAKAREVGAAIRHEIDRLKLNGMVPERFRGNPKQVIVSQLDPESASRYLAWLQEQPTPKAQVWEVSHAA
ncbi:hypothetical protein Lepto7375DRAFT_1739 [Leptolyngbya sp. PCC 7375]|nr:hypothetical protein Lepto7375DRAFT_1739 [Leptolyngbya sp. PCC 7375]